MEWILLLVAAFLLGSVPFGYLVAKARGVDIRTVGSGNIGATNVIRALDKKAGFAVLGLDVLKGLIPSLAGHFVLRPEFLQSQQEFALLAGLTAVAGHCFSPFIGFRGGKGVATGLGAMLGGSPLVAVISLGTFLLFLAITRYVSLSSIIAAGMMPVTGWLWGHLPMLIAAYGLLGGFIILRHTTNIRKIIAGTERRFGSPKEIVSDAQTPDIGVSAGNNDALAGNTDAHTPSSDATVSAIDSNEQIEGAHLVNEGVQVRHMDAHLLSKDVLVPGSEVNVPRMDADEEAP